MPKDQHRINRDREPDPDDLFTCEECGEGFPDEERLERHRERKKRETLRGSPIGDAILEIDSQRRRGF